MTYTVSTPSSPSCFEPALPIHTTLHFRPLSGSSSRTSSTTCPRLSRKFPRSLNPRSPASTTRHGILFWFRSRLMTRLARFFDAIRFDRRPSGTGEVGILQPLEAKHGNTPDAVRRQVIFAVRNGNPRPSSGFCKDAKTPLQGGALLKSRSVYRNTPRPPTLTRLSTSAAHLIP